MVSFQGLTQSRCWNNCSERVRGSDGTQFRPGVTRDQALEVWVAALFRSERFVFEEEVTWQQVKFLRYGPVSGGVAGKWRCIVRMLDSSPLVSDHLQHRHYYSPTCCLFNGLPGFIPTPHSSPSPLYKSPLAWSPTTVCARPLATTL